MQFHEVMNFDFLPFVPCIISFFYEFWFDTVRTPVQIQ